MTSLARRVGLALCLLSATSCALFDTDDVCAGESWFSMEVTVVDSLTNSPAAEGATLLTYDLDLGGVRVDSVTGRSNTETLYGTMDRRGTYTVVVRKDGYRDWLKTNVVVRGKCTIQSAKLMARLARP